MAGGDPVRFAQIAVLAGFVVASLSVLARLLRLSSLTSFVSETNLLGFEAGAALAIASTQLTAFRRGRWWRFLCRPEAASRVRVVRTEAETPRLRDDGLERGVERLDRFASLTDAVKALASEVTSKAAADAPACGP